MRAEHCSSTPPIASRPSNAPERKRSSTHAALVLCPPARDCCRALVHTHAHTKEKNTGKKRRDSDYTLVEPRKTTVSPSNILIFLRPTASQHLPSPSTFLPPFSPATPHAPQYPPPSRHPPFVLTPLPLSFAKFQQQAEGGGYGPPSKTHGGGAVVPPTQSTCPPAPHTTKKRNGAGPFSFLLPSALTELP